MNKSDKKLTPEKDSKLKNGDESKSDDDSRNEDGSSNSEMVIARTDSNVDDKVTEKRSSKSFGTRRNSGLLSTKKHERVTVKPNFELEPVFAGYQLVGDSQLLRFAQQILSIPRKIDCNGKGWLGLCVGGQRICDLHRRVLSGEIPIGKKLIVLIGTNDLLKGTSIFDMCKGLNSLLATLFKTARKIVLLTLPPVPKIAYLNEHWIKLKKYNEFIFTLRDHYHKTKLDVVDISPLFYQTKIKKCHLGFFELWFDGPVKRPDLIHINEVGFKLIRDLLLKQIM